MEIEDIQSVLTRHLKGAELQSTSKCDNFMTQIAHRACPIDLIVILSIGYLILCGQLIKKIGRKSEIEDGGERCKKTKISM